VKLGSPLGADSRCVIGLRLRRSAHSRRYLRASPADGNGIGTAHERALCGLIQAGAAGPRSAGQEFLGLESVAAASAAAGAEGLLADRSDGRALLVGRR